jgi:hypothetical protein
LAALVGAASDQARARADPCVLVCRARITHAAGRDAENTAAPMEAEVDRDSRSRTGLGKNTYSPQRQ